MFSKPELPYEFDLLYDVKTYEQVDRIANFESDRSDATPIELVLLFEKLNLGLPRSLESAEEQWIAQVERSKEGLEKHQATSSEPS